MCVIGVTSRIDFTSIPLVCSARIADSRPAPGPFTRPSTLRRPNAFAAFPAAIAACVGRPNLDVVVLHPAGRVSDVQRRQMTTVLAPNVHNLAVEGTFDDCQALVKGLFNHHAFRDRVRLSGVNSINWARIVAQVVYYFTAAATLGSFALRGRRED